MEPFISLGTRKKKKKKGFLKFKDKRCNIFNSLSTKKELLKFRDKKKNIMQILGAKKTFYLFLIYFPYQNAIDIFKYK